MAKATVIDKDRGWRQMVAGSKRSSREYVAVGILGNATPRDDGLTNAQVGTFHEYGAPEAGIPERSFIRATIDANVVIYRRLAKNLYARVVTGVMTSKTALGLCGTRVVADIKHRIQAGILPALKPATIRRKKSSKPLIDTSQMINAITYEVRSK